jgi:hypothetical protein
MGRYAFEATDEDGSPRLYVGMHRPPMMSSPGGYIMCSCAQVLQTVDQYRDHWQQGHFDQPMYEVKEEA